MTKKKTTKKPLTGLVLYLTLARDIRCATNSQNHLLLYYASRCDKTGRFHPGLDTIMQETGLCEDTVTEVNRYFRDTLKILTWSKGYKNRHMEMGVSNHYQFNLTAMQQLVRSQPSTPAQTRSAKRLAPRNGRLAPRNVPPSTPETSGLALPAQSGSKNHKSKNQKSKDQLTARESRPDSQVPSKLPDGFKWEDGKIVKVGAR
jgi:hypothetical protein